MLIVLWQGPGGTRRTFQIRSIVLSVRPLLPELTPSKKGPSVAPSRLIKSTRCFGFLKLERSALPTTGAWDAGRGETSQKWASGWPEPGQGLIEGLKGMYGLGGNATGLTPMGTCSELGLENTPELTAHGRSVRLAQQHCVLSWMDTLLAHHSGSCHRLVFPPPFAPSSPLSLPLPFPLLSFPPNVFFVPG